MGNTTVAAPCRSQFSSLQTKVWRLPGDSMTDIEFTLIILRHFRATGEKMVTVNGKEVHRSKDVIDSGGVIAFSAGGRDFTLTVVDYPGLRSYELKCGNTVVPSEADTVDRGDVVLEVSVPAFEVEGPAAVFVVVAKDSHGISASVRRQFHEFDELDVKVRSYFRGHHLYSSLPPLPPKYLKSLVRHDNPEFLMSRRGDLEAYLKRLAVFPHVATNPDFCMFLGLTGVAECRVEGVQRSERHDTRNEGK